MTMKLLDLFAGIGGFSLAAHQLGWSTVGFVEKDEFCRTLLRQNFGDTPIFSDIRDVNVDSIVSLLENSFSEDQLKEIDMAAKRKDYDEAVRMYERGLSIGDVASFYGISRQAMWAILKRRGVEFRPQQKEGEENHFHRGGSVADDQAQNLVERALDKGVLTRPTQCETCKKTPKPFKDGRSAIQAHHCDYNKPLEVMWLCQKCHHDWHKKNTAIARKEVQREVSDHYSIQVVTAGFP